jgi:diadenosine tetraphosphate (Ap4A) HIT family hydrolase
MMSIENQVQLARAGMEPAVVCQVQSGWVVLAHRQYLRGYCILLPDPVVPSLNDLKLESRGLYLSDMALVGDALLEVTDAYRINYAIMGNSDPFLHAHIVPRYLTEPAEIRQNIPWLYDPDFMEATQFNYTRDKELMDKLAGAIQKRL